MTATAGEQREFHPRELIVRFAPDVAKSNRVAAVSKAGARGIKRRFAGRHAVLDVAEDSLEKVLMALQADPIVERVEPNYFGYGGYEPTDYLYRSQWHLEQNNDVDINAARAWNFARGNPAIRVAVLDSGLKLGHPEFAGRIYVNPLEAANGRDDDGNGLIDDLHGWDFVGSADGPDNMPEDEHGHGTWVTSVFGANAGDGFGVAGVDHFAEILPIRVLDAQNRGTSADVIASLYYAADQGADVINLSLVDFPRTALLSDALDYAASRAILVACAGNGGPGSADLSYPGAHPEVITVGATQANDEIAQFSSTGTAVDLVAPGHMIVAADHQEPFEPDVANPVSGCSLATPIVTGVVSLMISKQPSLERDDVLQILAETAVDLGERGWDETFGWGRIDAGAALERVFGVPVSLDASMTVENSDLESRRNLPWIRVEPGG